MRQNNLKRALGAGAAVNAWLSIPSSYSAEIIANCSFDAVTVDLQHGMIDFGQAVLMLQAISTTPATPLARPSSADPVDIMRLLDAGAMGIICPQVDNETIAKQVVAACKYPPTGKRSFGPARGLLYGGSDYFEYANDDILVFLMIESREAVENLDSILAVEGADGIYIGPNDLSLSYGQGPSAYPTGQVAGIIEDIRLKAQEYELITGIFCADGAMGKRRLDQGFRIVTPGNDAALLKSSCQVQLGMTKGDKVVSSRSGY